MLIDGLFMAELRSNSFLRLKSLLLIRELNVRLKIKVLGAVYVFREKVKLIIRH